MKYIIKIALTDPVRRCLNKAKIASENIVQQLFLSMFNIQGYRKRGGAQADFYLVKSIFFLVKIKADFYLVKSKQVFSRQIKAGFFSTIWTVFNNFS